PGQPVSGGPNDTSVGEISVKTGNNARNGGKNSLNRLIRLFAGKKSAQIREILISESAWEEMTCLFAPSLKKKPGRLFGLVFLYVGKSVAMQWPNRK
ncbi:hypothetical protein FHB86_01770, partial [Escherichia coli]|nr:hypothetical protein [Escherichia coli]